MRVVVDGHRYERDAVDLRDRNVDADVLLAAVRDDSADGAECLDADGAAAGVRVACPTPTPSHEVLGHVVDCRTSLRTLLAAAARSRGQHAPQRPTYEAVRERLDGLQIPSVDLTEARRRVAAVGDDEVQLREEIATLRGRLQARREAGVDASDLATALTDAAARLSEVETRRVAAEQTLERRERRARTVRTTRERRLELQDRATNLEREMRTSLAVAVYPAFAAALDSLSESAALDDVLRETVSPGEASAGDAPSEYDGDLLTARLGAVRIAALDAPVVVSAPAFEDATSAATRLDSSVILR